MCAQSVSIHVANNSVAPAVDSLILMDARGKTLTLPDARSNAGLAITIKNTPNGAQTSVIGQAGQPLEGHSNSSYKLGPPLAFVRLESDGAGWWAVAPSGDPIMALVAAA